MQAVSRHLYLQLLLINHGFSSFMGIFVSRALSLLFIIRSFASLKFSFEVINLSTHKAIQQLPILTTSFTFTCGDFQVWLSVISAIAMAPAVIMDNGMNVSVTQAGTQRILAAQVSTLNKLGFLKVRCYPFSTFFGQIVILKWKWTGLECPISPLQNISFLQVVARYHKTLW